MFFLFGGVRRPMLYGVEGLSSLLKVRDLGETVALYTETQQKMSDGMMGIAIRDCNCRILSFTQEV
jgi:hypothetical protein